MSSNECLSIWSLFLFFSRYRLEEEEGKDGKLLRIVGHLVYWCLQFMIFYIYTLHTISYYMFTILPLFILFQLFSHVIDFQHPGCTKHRIQWVWSYGCHRRRCFLGFFEIFLAPAELLLRWIAGNTSPILAGLDHFKVDCVDCEKSCDLHKYILYKYKSLWIHIYVLPLCCFCTCWMYEYRDTWQVVAVWMPWQGEWWAPRESGT